MLVIGVMPLIGSYGQFFCILGPTLSVLLEPIMRVCPSGLELMTKPAAVIPAAPGRFSTTTGWPRISLMIGATARAVTSTLPPAANGTMIRIGSLGKLCDHPAAGYCTSKAANAAAMICLIFPPSLRHPHAALPAASSGEALH